MKERLLDAKALRKQDTTGGRSWNNNDPRNLLSSHRNHDALPSDDWTEVSGRPLGVPIGNLPSQLWGNFHLDPLAPWIGEKQRYGRTVTA